MNLLWFGMEETECPWAESPEVQDHGSVMLIYPWSQEGAGSASLSNSADLQAVEQWSNRSDASALSATQNSTQWIGCLKLLVLAGLAKCQLER